MEKDSKKRKRQSGDQQRPNKKASVGGTAESPVIRIHVDEDSELAPVLVSSHGLIPPKEPFTAYDKPLSTTRGSSKHHEPKTHDLLIHSSAHPRLDYSATSAAVGSGLAHYVGIFDASNKTLQLSPAYSLDLRTTLRPRPKDDDEEQERTMMEQRADLDRKFGTKKAKKNLAAKASNAITKDSSANGNVKDVILESMGTSAIPVLGEMEQLEAELASKPIPKPNLLAEEAEDVYPLDVLMPPADARQVPVAEWQEAAEAGVEIKLWHRFPAHRVAVLGRGDDIARLKALRYLALLLRFHDALESAGRSGGKKVPRKLKEKLSAEPETLVDSIRRRFANQQNELPKWHMDNLYTHICALSLYVDKWETNVTHLKDDLKMRENKEIVRYFRELGCTVAAPTEAERERVNAWFGGPPLTKSVGAATRVAKLKNPPDFPKARSGRKA